MRRFATILFSLFLVLILGQSLTAQTIDTVSIYDLQYVADPASDDLSPYLNDTVVVKGLVMTAPRDLWIGARWSMYIVDPDSLQKPWSGFFVVQNDTQVVETNMGFLEPGMICYFTGVVSEFTQFSQISLLTDPAVPINIISAGNPLPDPVELTAADLDQVEGEKWESMFVKVNDATIVNNSISGDWASFTDESAAVSYLAEYFNWFHDRLPAGTYEWPSGGTNIDVIGFTRDESGTPGQVFTVNPRDTFDLVIKSNPPVISDVDRNPGAPTPSDAVEVRAVITDNGSISSAMLNYSINEAPFQQVAMAVADGDTFSASIPVAADGDFVRYFITAEDNSGDLAVLPGDTSRATGNVYFYTVRDGALKIADLQDTHGYAVDQSGYLGYLVTVQGVVMTDSTDEPGDFYIQEAAEKWSGIWVAESQTFQKGDLIEITAFVEEDFTITRLDDATSVSLVTAGVGEYDPVVVTSGEMATNGENREAYEGVLVRIENATVTTAFPDAPSNFGEFAIDDGTGEVRVDDWFDGFNGGQTSDTLYYEGMALESLTGFGYFSFGNSKLIPRDTMDVVIVTSIERENAVARSFDLEQNYPNPFNPQTVIRYNLANQTDVKLVVYDALGREIKTLVNGSQSQGTYKVTFNAGKLASGVYFYRLQAGEFSAVKKMLLVR